MKSVSECAADRSHEGWIPLIEFAAREVFELMLGCQLNAPATAEEATPGITSMVALTGRLCGVLSIRCSEKAATLMASKMLGVTPDKASPEVADALGEICNMVAGNFKNKIVGLDDGCMLSPPTVITGSDYNLHTLADLPGLELTLLFEGMPIAISLQIHS
jgi:chemotaxis protein CheX